MNVVVTGASGFIGRRLIAALLTRGTIGRADGRQEGINKIRLVDRVAPADPFPEDDRLEPCIGDYSDSGAAADILRDDADVIFHLAAVVSGQAEQEFDLGIRVNLDGTRLLLDACRRLPNPPRLVFSSSVAVYGGELPPVIEDNTAVTPQTSYGTQKAASELLVYDYSRKGYIDGRSLRLPTIVVRAGKPNAAASSFASSVIREPLQGDPYACPVPGETAVWLLSPHAVVRCFLHAADLPADAFGIHRSLCLPGLTVTVDEMLAAIKDLAGPTAVERVSFAPDPFIKKIVSGWPTRFAPERALQLGFKADASIHDVIRRFIEDDLGGDIVG